MGFFIVLLIVGVIFVFFVMKGSGGKSFYKHRKDIHKTVEQNGGMHRIYETFVDFFKNQGFQIREVNKDSLYLHYGTQLGKIGIQIVQTDTQQAEILMGCEMRSGESHQTTIKVNINEDQEAMIERLVGNFSNGELLDFKSMGLNFQRN